MNILLNRFSALALLNLLVATMPPTSRATELRRFIAKSDRVKSIVILQDAGARARFSPDSKLLVFDRPGNDGFYNVYVSDLQGNIVHSITAQKPGINHRNNGNARFDPAGRYIVFVSEEDRHFGQRAKALGDPGVGLYSNFWATDLEGNQFWKLTNVATKQSLLDGVPSMADVNPLFSPDGRAFLWTERYAEGGNNKWGKWRIKAARFSDDSGRPVLVSPYTLITPKSGNYITAMGFLSPSELLVAGNLDGQHEYAMDQYSYNFKTGNYVNFTQTPEAWDEDSCVAPNGQIIWMSNVNSKYHFDFSRADWPRQPVTRDYYLMDRDGKNKTQLTHFNDPDAPEYLGNRVLVAACNVSPDGRYLAGTIGVDQGKGDHRENVVLKVILIELNPPLSGLKPILQ